jgi:hypothetical protein
MKTMLLALVLVAGAAAAEETNRPVVVISTTGGASAGAATAGGEVGLYSEAGRFRYGASALVTAGDSSWAGGLLNARYALFETPWSPYFGLGIGAFSARRGALDLGVQPTAAFEAGVEYQRFFAGARTLVPLSRRSSGPQAHDVSGFGDVAILAQLGFRI